ncbi:hypothetical protein CEXT_336231 [Caerostris extrusa]|uniref:Uncharacterized protein n=1 Tax=Caerostris extrusa TaxID=172846 RepID=A0AAV4Q3S4_CAEEX|nr:hypothetical protein CEXT_336231 [Caerostris extrusa]
MYAIETYQLGTALFIVDDCKDLEFSNGFECCLLTRDNLVSSDFNYLERVLPLRGHLLQLVIGKYNGFNIEENENFCWFTETTVSVQNSSVTSNNAVTIFPCPPLNKRTLD